MTVAAASMTTGRFDQTHVESSQELLSAIAEALDIRSYGLEEAIPA